MILKLIFIYVVLCLETEYEGGRSACLCILLGGEVEANLCDDAAFAHTVYFCRVCGEEVDIEVESSLETDIEGSGRRSSPCIFLCGAEVEASLCDDAALAHTVNFQVCGEEVEANVEAGIEANEVELCLEADVGGGRSS